MTPPCRWREALLPSFRPLEKKPEQAFASYIHMGGKISVLVTLMEKPTKKFLSRSRCTLRPIARYTSTLKDVPAAIELVRPLSRSKKSKMIQSYSRSRKLLRIRLSSARSTRFSLLRASPFNLSYSTRARPWDNTLRKKATRLYPLSVTKWAKGLSKIRLKFANLIERALQKGRVLCIIGDSYGTKIQNCHREDFGRSLV
jgi:hypothetical protein